MNRYFKILLTVFAILVCISLAACSDAGDTDQPDSDGGTQNTDVERVAIHTVDLDVDAKDIGECLDDLTNKNIELGGFIENVTKDYYDNSLNWVNVVLRVPTEKKDELVAYISGTYEVTDKRETSSNVINRYNTTLSQKGVLEEKKAELEKMLENVELSANDRINVINEIATVKAEISDLEKRLAESDEDMRYSTVRVRIYQPEGFFEVFIPLFIFVILPLGATIISIWRATVKRNRVVRARREQEAKAAEAARMAQNNSQIH
jgi:hypothetical protein